MRGVKTATRKGSAVGGLRNMGVAAGALRVAIAAIAAPAPTVRTCEAKKRIVVGRVVCKHTKRFG